MKDITGRADLEQLIVAFYEKLFADEQIGFIFTEVAPIDPETHFPVLVDFWEGVLLGQNRYQGNVVRKHIELNRLHPLQAHHFEVWLDHFCRTVDELFEGPVAENAKMRARSIAVVLETKIYHVSKASPAG
ncbi:group III truncated hemoglobin [Larkinella soli]|uniref:group III truncated hemoglobin n=1 Tax=Larkinella soli TaxID=1770527 RepID=UPI000FFC27C6|nr:group III truncated hemoglobin [Larkinella soli]